MADRVITLDIVTERLKETFPENLKLFDIVELDLKTNYLTIRTKYGLCKSFYSNLLRGFVPTIKASINKEEYFVNQLKESFPEGLLHYEVNKYKDSENVYLNTKYGLCKAMAVSLLRGQLPSIFMAVNKNEYFMNRISDKYKERYSFERFNYVNNSTKTELICKEHGSFKIIPATILIGYGCRKCANKETSKRLSENPTGWSLSNWYESACRSTLYDSFKVYIIECWDENEHFYKIGRTFNKPKKRFTKFNLPYNYKILKIHEFKSLTEENAKLCYSLEASLKRQNKVFKYVPTKTFDGMQECFTQIKEI